MVRMVLQVASIHAKPYVECLLQVTGDAAGLNTFDKLFRSGKGPSWADRASDGVPRYSLHALFPVPEAIQRRGYGTAGHLWCGDFWDVCRNSVQPYPALFVLKRRTDLILPRHFFAGADHV